MIIIDIRQAKIILLLHHYYLSCNLELLPLFFSGRSLYLPAYAVLKRILCSLLLLPRRPLLILHHFYLLLLSIFLFEVWIRLSIISFCSSIPRQLILQSYQNLPPSLNSSPHWWGRIKVGGY